MYTIHRPEQGLGQGITAFGIGGGGQLDACTVTPASLFPCLFFSRLFPSLFLRLYTTSPLLAWINQGRH